MLQKFYDRFKDDFLHKGSINIVCLGDSITEGCFEQGNKNPLESYPHKLFKLLKEALVRRGVPCGDVQVQYAPGRAGDIPHSFADISRAEKELGYRSCYDIESGIREMVGYYMENFDSK